MNSIARLLKETVERVARKRVRSETRTLRKASGQHRKALSDLYTRLREMERKLALVQRQLPAGPLGAGRPGADNLRFSAKGLQSLRKRLGLSATECGILLGATAHMVGKWERGEARPSGEQLNAVAGLRDMGKREALLRLEEKGRGKK